MADFVAVILAGGTGQRFWPLSTPEKPKQFLDLEQCGRTLLQSTYDRLLPLVGSQTDILVITGERYKNLVKEQLPEIPEENIVLEPVGRDTAPAIAYAALEVEKRYGNVMMGLFTSDHKVIDDHKFQENILTAYNLTKRYKGLTTVGITPSYPATGFGYIQQGEAVDYGFKVQRFVEKPNEETATSYIESGNYTWNNGIFLWYTDTILWELSKYAPELIRRLKDAFVEDKLEDVFPSLPKISIDYAVLEKTERAYVVPADYGWDDLGDWVALERLVGDETDINTVVGKHIAMEASGNIIYTTNEDDVVVTLGVQDLVVVKKGNTVLLMPKDRVQDLKKLLSDERLADIVID